VASGKLPDGLDFKEGLLTGVSSAAGVYPLELQIRSADRTVAKIFNLVVRGANLAGKAAMVLTNVRETNVAARDSMWLTVPYSLYANTVDVIRDAKNIGDGSTFYSVDGAHSPKIDYYGYEWAEPFNISLIGFHTGAMEENSGWFTSLHVQYQDENGVWKPVNNLLKSPTLLSGDEPFNKAHFVEYLLAFEPISTRAVRIFGDAGNAKHWYSKSSYFTSISELTVHGNLPGYKQLAEH
jgi:hypothetical protein